MRSEFLIQDYQGKFILNPLIRSYKNPERIETILATKNPTILHNHDFMQRKDRYVLLRILKNNIRIGQLFGLEKKAVRSLKNVAAELKGISKGIGIPMIIIGTINSFDEMHNRHLGLMNRELKEYARQEGIEYIDLYSAFSTDKDQYFGGDHYHLNENGHEVTAQKLYAIIKNVPAHEEVLINS
jgi:lysophospholipase L1-like esterase